MKDQHLSIINKIKPVLTLLPALSAGLVVCMLLAAAVGAGPLDLVETIWIGSWGSADAAINTLTKLTPLLLTGLAVALAYRAGLLNIGCEGQLTLGALASAAFAQMAASMPPFLLLPLTLLAGAVAGGIWAYPAVLLRRRRDVHEVISTLLLNYVAIYLCSYLVSGPLGDGTAMGRTPPIPPGAQMPPILSSGSLFLTPAPLIALVLCFVAALWLQKTIWGFEATSAGANLEAAANAGISAEQWQTRVFIASGALAGFAGAMEICAVHHRFYRSFSPGYGFDGLTAAFLVNSSPEWLWLSTLFLASLRSADKLLQIGLNISPNFILVAQAVLLLSVVCQARIRFWLESLLSRLRRGSRQDVVSAGTDSADSR
ncbi:MAG: ABC transporter permease [Syntrophobacteraceae bacterium]